MRDSSAATATESSRQIQASKSGRDEPSIDLVWMNPPASNRTKQIPGIRFRAAGFCLFGENSTLRRTRIDGREDGVGSEAV